MSARRLVIGEGGKVSSESGSLQRGCEGFGDGEIRRGSSGRHCQAENQKLEVLNLDAETW